MEATDFKNVIWNKIHWANFETAEAERLFLRSPRPKYQNHLGFMTFHCRIFVILVFDKISKGMLVTIEKELGEYFQRLYFWKQWVPLIKMYCKVRYLFDFDLKIHSGQVWVIKVPLKEQVLLLYLPKSEWEERTMKTCPVSPPWRSGFSVNLLVWRTAVRTLPWQLWKKLFQDESLDLHTREWDDNACIIGVWHNSLDRSPPWYLESPLLKLKKGNLPLRFRRPWEEEDGRGESLQRAAVIPGFSFQ